MPQQNILLAGAADGDGRILANKWSSVATGLADLLELLKQLDCRVADGAHLHQGVSPLELTSQVAGAAGRPLEDRSVGGQVQDVWL